MAPDKTPPPEPTPALVTMPAHLLDELVGLLKDRRAAGGDPESPGTTERMLLALEAQAASTKRLGEEFARTTRRSNAAHPNLSVFTYDKRCEFCVAKKPHPVLDADGQVVIGAEGELAHPKVRLLHQVFVCGGPQHEDQLTPLELELFNQFTGSKSSRGGTWTATVQRDGTSSRLFINFPAKTLDNLMDLPRTLAEVLGELLYGEDAVDAHDLIGEVAKLKRQLAALTAATASAKPVAAAV